MLSVPADENAYTIYDPEVPMELRIQQCLKNQQVRYRAAKAMVDMGYLEIDKRRTGQKDWEKTTSYRLTKAGIFFLTNTPNESVENERLSKVPGLQNRNKKNITYSSQDPVILANRQVMYDIAKKQDPTEEDRYIFERLFLESVDNEDISILGAEPYLAESVQIGTRLRAEAFYRGWKQMNINALFKINGYLTSIDRRHIQPTAESMPDITPIEFYDFCTSVLTRWYEQHPASFIYQFPQEKYANQVKKDWITKPTFYPISDIDDTLIEIAIESSLNTKSTTKSYRHLCIGIAVGKEKNYIVHHTKRGGISWAELIERNTIGSVQQRLNKANEQTPILGGNRSISNAIIVCPTVQQFVALFDGLSETYKEEKKRKYRIGTPYDTVSIVTLNPSGSMLLRALMESSPLNFERAIVNYLLQYDGFAERPVGSINNDHIFSLNYQNRPVFIAHTMNWKKLAIAKDQYDEGRRFYVSCYPEQTKFIQALMPNIEFL